MVMARTVRLLHRHDASASAARPARWRARSGTSSRARRRPSATASTTRASSTADLAPRQVHRQTCPTRRWAGQRPGLHDDVDVCKHCAHASCMDVCPTGADHPHRVRHRLHPAGRLQRLPQLHRRLPLRRHRLSTRTSGSPRSARSATTGCRAVSSPPAPRRARPSRSSSGPARRCCASRRASAERSCTSRASRRRSLYGDKEYGGLHALFLLTDKPEAYGLPNAENAVLPGRNNVRGYLGSLVTAVLGVVRRRRRAPPAAAEQDMSAHAQHFVGAAAVGLVHPGTSSWAGSRAARYFARRDPALLGQTGRRAGGPARLLVALPAMVICPILLTLDLGRPLRFWHMLVDSRTLRPELQVLVADVGRGLGAARRLRLRVRLVRGGARARRQAHPAPAAAAFGAAVVMVVGSRCVGLCSSPATPACCSRRQQPAHLERHLGARRAVPGLGASVAAAALVLLAGGRRRRPSTEAKLARADRYFIVLELMLLVVFFVSLGAIGARFLEPRWLGLWAAGAAGTSCRWSFRSVRPRGRRGCRRAVLVLVGGLALRIVVIFGAQM